MSDNTENKISASGNSGAADVPPAPATTVASPDPNPAATAPATKAVVGDATGDKASPAATGGAGTPSLAVAKVATIEPILVDTIREARPELINAPDLPPVTAAGVEIIKYVLALVCLSILALSIYLICMERSINDDIAKAYGNAAERNPGGRVQRFIADLKDAEVQAAFTLSIDGNENAQIALTILERVPGVTLEKMAVLRKCHPLPTAADRAQQLKDCIGILVGLDASAVARAGSALNAATAAEAVNKLNEHRQAMRAFWIQAAQLLLLNLLLPVITALLGYIFGTTQASR